MVTLLLLWSPPLTIENVFPKFNPIGVGHYSELVGSGFGQIAVRPAKPGRLLGLLGCTGDLVKLRSRAKMKARIACSNSDAEESDQV